MNSSPSSVRVQFWGTRGALAKPGRSTLRYGGNTACVQVTSSLGTQVIIDCGTGAHDLGKSLLACATGPLRGSVLISHTHWDHIQGFPFFAPLFEPDGRWDIYGPAGLGQSLKGALEGQMQYTYFPVKLEEMGADIHFHDLAEGEFQIEDIRVTTRYLNHPVLTLAYRLEVDGVCVVYACDHEPYSWDPAQPGPLHERDLAHADFAAGADLLIHDAQFMDAEYPKCRGWGHSTTEYVAEIALAAEVRQVALTHHDPNRSDVAVDKMVAAVQQRVLKSGTGPRIFAAADGLVLDIQGSGRKAAARSSCHAEAAVPVIENSSVIMGISDPGVAAVLADATSGEAMQTVSVSDGDAVLKLAYSTPPAMVVLEDHPPEIEGFAICQRLRAGADHRLKDVPVVMVTDREKEGAGMQAGVTGWLVKPFSAQYARAHMQAWIMRSNCRWVKARVPADEESRLAALHALALLDTPPEERFDRITRIAAGLTEVPVVLVSLVDQDRQWFKSCVGLGATETPRELAFCAHVVHRRERMIVEDSHLDERFADHPLVTGAPYIRFYAGFPIFHSSGACLGTLCIIDTRPRQLSAEQVQLMVDLAALVEREANMSRQTEEV